MGGASIALSGVLLVWATRTYRSRPARGVGLAFLMVAFGQAVGAPPGRTHADATSLAGVCYVSALVALALTCDVDNEGSRLVIEHNGGVLEDRRGTKLRFWCRPEATPQAGRARTVTTGGA